MSASTKLNDYLDSFERRLRHLTILQGFAALTLTILLLSALGAYFSMSSGYANATTILFRLLLLLIFFAAIIRFLIQPLHVLKSGISCQLESRAANYSILNHASKRKGFDGRIETYTRMQLNKNPFLELLAEETLSLTPDFPIEGQIKTKEFHYAGLITACASTLLIYLLIAGPSNLNYSLRNFLAGWAIDDLLPPQSITVTPGNLSIKRGTNLTISAVMNGFDPDDANLHVKNSDTSWQQVSLISTPTGFEFTLFSIQEPVTYYISTNGLRSPAFTIEVVELPAIEKLSLTYHYPQWSERNPESFSHGDIDALANTRIALTLTTSSPLQEGTLVLNNSSQAMSLSGNEAFIEFTIQTEGEYYLAAKVGNELVRLSDDYFISISEDGKPIIEFIHPREDYKATSIEEVLTKIRASDDYALEDVALTYSINGGKPLTIALPSTGRNMLTDHIFMLEDMYTQTPKKISSKLGAFTLILGEELAQQAIDSNDSLPTQDKTPISSTNTDLPLTQTPLQPGDLISYYAEAMDRSQTVRTDMFFIEIQPFNRRYSQSQLSGGNGSSDPQTEISQRQRQIIVSTWNLLRKQAEEQTDGQIQINASLLSELQATLAEQAQTLANRTRARQLNQDQEIQDFVSSLDLAIQSMHPSSQHLASFDLEAALQPAQEALKHLLKAESIFNDISVSQQQANNNSAGGTANQDLAEMFELEMDLEKNQYESGNTASPQAQQQQQNDLMDKLDELARRQEQLANNMRNQEQLSLTQKYQQEMLTREVEELQQQLESMQTQGQQNPNNTQQQSPLQRRVESALRALQDTANAMDGNINQAELQRAASEAQHQLEGARDQISDDQLVSMQESFSNMAEQATSMLRQQQIMDQTLQNAMRTALAERESGEDPNSRGMALQQEWALAKDKQNLVADLQTLQQQMISGVQRFNEQTPAATRELQQANAALIANELEQIITESALYIESGYGLYIAGNESTVTTNMRELATALERAQRIASSATTTDESDLEKVQQKSQSLRLQLQQHLANSKSTTSATAQIEPWSGSNPEIQSDSLNLPETFFRDLDQLTQLTRTALPQIGLNVEELDSMYDLIRELEFTRVNPNDTIGDQQYSTMLTLLEQLEFGLNVDSMANNPNNVRTSVIDIIPEEFKESVAEYYRRLSRD